MVHGIFIYCQLFLLRQSMTQQLISYFSDLIFTFVICSWHAVWYSSTAWTIWLARNFVVFNAVEFGVVWIVC